MPEQNRVRQAALVEVPEKSQVSGKYESNGAQSFPALWLDNDDLAVDLPLVMQILGRQRQRPRIDNQQAAHAPAGLLRFGLTRHRLVSYDAPPRHDATQETAERFINLTRPRNYSVRQPAQFLTRACSTAVVEQRITDLVEGEPCSILDLRLCTIPRKCGDPRSPQRGSTDRRHRSPQPEG